MAKQWLGKLKFNNNTVHSLPIDPLEITGSRQVPNAIFSRQKPNINLISPKLVAVSHDCLNLLNDEKITLSHSDLEKDKDFIDVFCGGEILEGSEPHSHCYAGHQFGVFAGQLGDGTVNYLGELETSHGQRQELQLKGAGKTPYSRTADGKKVLRSSIREFLASEHMHALGIPTTRSASVITSFESKAQRYDATRVLSPKSQTDCSPGEREVVDYEPCAVTSRVAPSFLRFGSFEIVKNTPCPLSNKTGPSAGNKELLDTLLKFTISTYFPEVEYSKEKELENGHVQKFFEIVAYRTAEMVAHWQAVGFCHGVLNTDNMSVLGLTIDYGPYAFMDYYDPDYTCNFSDNYGRYSFRNQPQICKWNLNKFQDVLMDVGGYRIDFDENLYDATFTTKYNQLMKEKLGLVEMPTADFLKLLFETMESSRADFTNTFLSLEGFAKSLQCSSDSKDQLIKMFAEKIAGTVCQTPTSIKRAITPVVNNGELIQVIQMIKKNKIPLEYIFGAETDKVDSTARQINRLIGMANLRDTDPAEKLKNDVEGWTKVLNAYAELKIDVSSFKNPRIVLRNYLAQEVITKAEKGDFEPTRQLLEKLMKPYDGESATQATGDGVDYVGVPDWAEGICVSCSS